MATKKVAVIYILKILEEHSDYYHPLKQEDIAKHLRSYGIEIDRRAVKRNVDVLIEAGYDIMELPHKGIYLASRDFDDGELRMLIDCVTYAKNISTKQATDLIGRLKSLGSRQLQKQPIISPNSAISRGVLQDDVTNVDIINNAIANDEQLSFMYNEYQIDKKLYPVWGKEKIVNVYQLVISGGNYYILGNIDDQDDIQNFRLDRITNLKKLHTRRKNIRNTKEGSINVSRYISTRPFMSQGKDQNVIVRIKKDAIGKLIDSFGTNYNVVEQSVEHVDVSFYANSQDIVLWCLMNSAVAEIVEPTGIHEQVLQIARQMSKKYVTREERNVLSAIEDAQESKGLELVRANVGNLLNDVELPNITYATMRISDVKDISFLQNSPLLKYVSLELCAVEDLSPLASLPTLEALTIQSLPVKSLVPLANMGISDLTICDIDALDYSPILQMTNLRHLEITKELWQKLDNQKLMETHPNLKVNFIDNLYVDAPQDYFGLRKYHFPNNLLEAIFNERWITDWTFSAQDKKEIDEIFLTACNECLTKMEKQVAIDLFKNGLSYKQLANKLHLRVDAVDSFIAYILRRLRNPRQSKKLRKYLPKAWQVFLSEKDAKYHQSLWQDFCVFDGNKMWNEQFLQLFTEFSKSTVDSSNGHYVNYLHDCAKRFVKKFELQTLNADKSLFVKLLEDGLLVPTKIIDGKEYPCEGLSEAEQKMFQLICFIQANKLLNMVDEGWELLNANDIVISNFAECVDEYKDIDFLIDQLCSFDRKVVFLIRHSEVAERLQKYQDYITVEVVYK